jgi:aminoglycoside 6-adenylyltransferase
MKTDLDKTLQMPKMRSEDEMLGLILATAREDERIRAVILNGSRANPNAFPDRFQDFDVVYMVTDVAPFVNDPRWIDRFGERLILQTPSLMDDPPPDPGDHFTYLMQFTDGNRIDLTLIPVEQVSALKEDSLSVLLLDKDDRFPPFPPPSEVSYFPQPPTAKAFGDCCNEFWWVAPYVAKSLARGEIVFAHHVFESALRQQLIKMLTWLFGNKTGFKRNPGKAGKHFKEVLSPKHWGMLLGTYSTAEVDATWEALFMMGALFRECAQEVVDVFGFVYPTEEDRRVSQYLQSIFTSTFENAS